MKAHRDLTWIGVVLMMAACAMVEPKEVTFLRSAAHHATQQEVRERLGSPTLTTVSGDDAVWIYHAWDLQPGNRITASGAWCDEYVLSFDNSAVLQGYGHRRQFHAGETMPGYCVRGGHAAVRTAE
jgi:hypothetical protein